MEKLITEIIINAVEELKRPDLFRKPIVAFSDADDPRYEELKTLIGDWHCNPEEILPGAKSVISYFVPFAKGVAGEPRQCADGSFKWSEAYQEINKYFDLIGSRVVFALEEAGFEGKTIKATHTYNPATLKSVWSHRSAAVIAGLGTFGANKLVITEKGSAGRFCTVITTADLKASDVVPRTKCLYFKNGSCGLCFKVCPVNALDSDFNHKFDCQDELNKNERKMKEHTDLISADTCGKCISVCPFAYIE